MMKKRNHEHASDNENSSGFNEAMGDMSSMINSGFSVLSGASREMKELVRTWVEASLQRMAVPSREDFDELKARIDALQQRVITVETEVKKSQSKDT